MKDNIQLEIQEEVTRQLKAEKLRLAKMIEEKLVYLGQNANPHNLVAVIKEWANS